MFRMLCVSITLFIFVPLVMAETTMTTLDIPKYQPPTITEIKTHPESLVIEDGFDAKHVLVSGKTVDGNWIDLTPYVSYKAADSKIAVADNGYFEPQEMGESKVTITYKAHSVDVPVTVINADDPDVSFVRNVMPVLSKIGCNAGACHGAQAGKNGFKLSLRGYDPEYDYQVLIRDISGRRFNRAKPEKSLMLMKPTQGVPHEGGLVLDEESRHYKMIYQWIKEGVKPDMGIAQRPVALEVVPNEFVLDMPGMMQQMHVNAVFPDGSKRNITRDCKFTSTFPDVAAVDENGLVTALRRGESAVLVRYEGAFSTNNLIVMGDRSGFVWQDQPELNYVDTLVYNKLEELKILPSEVCTDEEFIRRAYLDLTGIPPQPKTVLAFLDNKSENKRIELVDELIGNDEYVEQWTHKIADLLQCNRKYLGEKGVWVFRMWIRDAVKNNVPYDKFVSELIMASGSTYQNPAANFYRVNREPSTAVENITQVFLGVRFQCAKCHDHPFEKWTQEQYYQLGAFFGSVGLKTGSLPDEEIVFTKYADAEVIHPKKNTAVPALVPYGKTDDNANLQREIAEWLTSSDNDLFARSTVNRFWSYFTGKGIIEPVDDIRNSNPPSNPELLDKLTKEFIDSGFDLRHLIRTICTSRVYQHSVKSNEWNEGDERNFSHAIARRLSAEQMLDAISVATGTTPDFGELPEGFRACELPDSTVKDEGGFLKLFGRPERESACECERTSEVSLSHALTLINGPTVSDAIADPVGRVAKLVEANIDRKQMVKDIYLAALSRNPKQEELNNALAFLEDSKNLEEGGQDLLWALINSPAFLFNR